MKICQCGCGKEIPFKKHHRKNPPMYIKGHSNRDRKRKTYDVQKAFWDRVQLGDSEGCWEWQGYIMPNGYGQLKEKEKNVYAHRYSYRLHNDELPDEMLVCHTCDNRKCVNPKHLFLGTAKDNIHDMMQKGRNYKGKPGTTKLNEEKVRMIRSLCNKGIDKNKIAEEFGVVRSTIANIEARRLWKDVL